MVVEEKGRLVGYLAATPRKFGSRKSKYIEIDNMGVSPDFRSKGVGSLLIAKLREWVKKNGYDRIYVNSYFKNLKAISFYKNSGFSEIDVSLEMGV